MESETATIELVILLSVIGSITEAESLYIREIITSFITGYSIISIITSNPKALTAFFIIKAYPATEAIASEKAFPTIGIKLSTANFVVLRVTASIVEDVIPLTAKNPM